MSRFSCTLVFAAGLFVSLPALAEDVTFTFTGTVEEVDVSTGGQPAEFAVNDPVTITYTFDSLDTDNQAGDSTTGYYLSSIGAGSVQIGSYNSTTQSGNILVFEYSNRDRYTAEQMGNSNPPALATCAGADYRNLDVSLALVDYDQVALAGDSLPTTLNVAEFEDRSFEVRFAFENFDTGQTICEYLVRGSLDAPSPGITCDAGSSYDWDGDGTDDGCRGTDVTMGEGVTIPAGTQVGNNVSIMPGSVMGTGNVLYDNVTLAPGVILGADNTLQTGVTLGRRATVGTGVTLLANTTVGRTASIGDNSQVGGSLGYASRVGSNVNLPDMVLGNLAAIGSLTTPAAAIDCPGPLVLARSTAIAADPAHTFTCTGLVIVGPESTVESADVGSSVRMRKDVNLFSHVTTGSNIRIGRGVQVTGGVELADGTRVAANVALCDTTAAFSGFLPRTYIDSACP